MDTTKQQLKTVCAWCNLHTVNGRTIEQEWDRVEIVSHGICLDCSDENFPTQSSDVESTTNEGIGA